jgi:hypothetical protein
MLIRLQARAIGASGAEPTRRRHHSVEILDQRVTDGVIRRMIDKWLNTGVLEEGNLHFATEGTPQGGVMTPLTQKVTSPSIG